MATCQFSESENTLTGRRDYLIFNSQRLHGTFAKDNDSLPQSKDNFTMDPTAVMLHRTQTSCVLTLYSILFK